MLWVSINPTGRVVTVASVFFPFALAGSMEIVMFLSHLTKTKLFVDDFVISGLQWLAAET